MQNLINNLINQGILKTPSITRAFKEIDRADFILPEDKYRAYENYPLSIGFGQTISQPLTVAFMLELLQVQPGDKILDVGAGSGWQTALLAHCVSKEIPNYKSQVPNKFQIPNFKFQNKDSLLEDRKCGRVYAIERIPELCEFGKANVAKYNFLQKGVVEFICGDGSKGLPEQAPFDKIITAAAAEEVPTALKDQLKISGRLVLPVGKHDQAIVKIDRVSENKFTEEKYPGFVFVPLVSNT